MKSITFVSGVVCLSLLPLTVMAADIYKVTRVGQGNSLNLRKWPSPQSQIEVAIPHNASWIVKRGASKKVGDSIWDKVVWNDQAGWVNNGFLSLDPASTRLAEERERCLVNPAVKNKLCCGFPASERGKPFKHIDIMTVTGIAQGKTLPMRTEPGRWKGNVVVAIPHNATWIAYMNKDRKLPNGEIWTWVRWNGQDGWVNKANIRFDKATTQLGDRKRRICSVGQ